jgi:hypothetical protein
MGIKSPADYRNHNLIRKLGIEALTKELGPLGMVCFLRLFDQGEGDYTKERHAVLDNITFDDIKRDLGLSVNDIDTDK